MKTTPNMNQGLLALMLCLAPLCCCFAEQTTETIGNLPTPNFQTQAADPPWLAQAAQFHGHLGPWAAAGLRVGMALRRAVDARGYFDVDVTVEGPFVAPPRSCFLDGIQVSTGATLGKRNLHWTDAETIVVRMQNTRTGKTAEARFTPELMKLVTSFRPQPQVIPAAGQPDEHDGNAEHGEHDEHGGNDVEAVARKIARMPEKKIVRLGDVAK